jgi:Uri superfamily endonuclease
LNTGKELQVTSCSPLSERSTHHLPPITIVGDASLGGIYLLRIRVTEGIDVVFGRFKKGEPISVRRGEYVYVGSALKGLGQRLVRHATRSGDLAPHPIRRLLIDRLPVAGLGKGNLLPAKGKTVHWHVDYLLDQVHVLLTHVLILRSSEPLEADLGRIIEQDQCTYVLEKGLGAKDVPGNTHLLRVRADEAWWHTLPGKLGSPWPVHNDQMNR